MALSHVVSEIFNVENVVTLKSGSKVTQGHWKWYHSIDCVWFPISVLQYAPFLRYSTCKYTVTLKHGLRSSKWYHSIRIQDFLLTFHSNHQSTSHRFRDKWRFPSKSSIFSHPHVFNASAEWVPLGIGYWRKGSKKLQWWGYQMVEKSNKIALVIRHSTGCDRQTVGQTRCHSKDCAMLCIAWVITIFCSAQHYIYL